HSRSWPFSRSMFLFGRRGDYCRLFLSVVGGGFLTWWHRGSAPIGLCLLLYHRGDLCRPFFCSQRLLGYRCSVLLWGRCDRLRCRFGFFLFRFVNLNHLAGLKLIRKIRRSRLLCLRHLCTGEANTSTHNEGAHDAGRHGENVLSMAATSTHGLTMKCWGARRLNFVVKGERYANGVRRLCFSLPQPTLPFGSSPRCLRWALAPANTQNGTRATGLCANWQQWIVSDGKRCSAA